MNDLVFQFCEDAGQLFANEELLMHSQAQFSLGESKIAPHPSGYHVEVAVDITSLMVNTINVPLVGSIA